MVETIEFCEVVWNPKSVTIPVGNKIYALAHIEVSPIDDGGYYEDDRLYALSLSRTKEVICNIKVKCSEAITLRALQNMILKTRL